MTRRPGGPISQGKETPGSQICIFQAVLGRIWCCTLTKEERWLLLQTKSRLKWVFFMEDPQATQKPRQLAGVSPVSNLCTALGAPALLLCRHQTKFFTTIARG